MIPQEAFAQAPEGEALCTRLSPTSTGGRNDVLGIFLEAGVVCQASPLWQLKFGWRYTDQSQHVSPFGVVLYTTPLPLGWYLSIATSYRERLGDYEGHRLPELILRRTWDSPSWVPSLELSAGVISVLQPPAQAGRVGTVAELRTPFWSLTPTTEVVGNLRTGLYAYDSGQSHSFWVAGMTAVQRLPLGLEFRLIYTRQEGVGSSPIRYDATAFDHYFITRLGWPMGAALKGGVSATFNLYTPAITVREYGLTVDHASGFGVGVTLRVSDSRLFLTLSTPQ